MATLPEALCVEAPAELTPGERRLRWFEVSLVILTAVGSSFISSLNVLIRGQDALPHNASLRWAGLLLHEAACLMLLGYVLRRRKLRFRDLGLQWDVGAGVGVAVASYIAYLVGSYLVYSIHRALFGLATSGVNSKQMFGTTTVLAFVMAFVNPFFEELIVRAYLMTEVKALTGSWGLSILASVVIQTSYHLYYGWQGALSISFQFLTFAIYYAWKRKATPIVVAHGLFDVYAMFRLL